MSGDRSARRLNCTYPRPATGNRSKELGCYISRYLDMVRKTQKNLWLPIDLVDRLEEEDNQGATAAEALREYFDTEDGADE